MGMLTKPKLILPFQIARIAVRISHRALKVRGITTILNRAFSANSFQSWIPGALPQARIETAPSVLGPLRRELELITRDAAELKQTDQRFLDKVIRA